MARRQPLPTVADVDPTATIEALEDDAAELAQELVDMTNQESDPAFRVRSKAALRRRQRRAEWLDAFLAAIGQRIDQLIEARGEEDDTALRLRLHIYSD
jgi:hypothetical protein